MKKFFGISTIVFALVVGILPLFTDCLSQGLTLKTAAGTAVPMKCHWTALAEMALAIPLGLIGVLNLTSKRVETFRSINLLGISIGALVILVPTVLIGVCANPEHICNMFMKPALILLGTLVIASGVGMVVKYRKNEVLAS